MKQLALALLITAPLVVAFACKKKDEQPPPQQPQYAPQAPGAQPYPGQPAPTVPPPVQTVPTAAAPAPVPGAPTAAGTLSQPSPAALPCTADANCLTHRCNTQFQKCAWPCQSDTDCNPGNRCTGGACLPAVQ